MNGGTIAGPHLRNFHPGVLFKVGGNHEMLILNRASGGNLVVEAHPEHCVRFPNAPAGNELAGRRSLSGIALLSARIRPPGKGFHFTRRQRLIIRKFAEMRIGQPGRHLPQHHSLPNRLRPRADLLVSQERHGCRFSRPVTDLTAFLQDRQHVLVELRSRRGGIRRGDQENEEGDRVSHNDLDRATLNQNSSHFVPL